jgi:signal transduction histidine kinase
LKQFSILFVLLSAINGFAFKTTYTDSMANEAKKLPAEEAVGFMLDNFYSVYSKNYEDGIKWTENALFYSQTLSNKNFEGRSNLSLGTVWYLKGDYEKCIRYYQTALDIFEEIDDKAWMGRTYNQMSVYSRKQKQYQKGLEQLDLSFELCTSSQDMECVETSLNNRGVIYEMMGDYERALIYYRKAETIALQTNNELGLSYIYNNLAECHRLMENYDSVAYYVGLSTEIRFRTDDFTGVAMNYANLGEMYTLSGDFKKAEEYLLKAVELTKEIQYLDLERHTYDMLFKLKKAEGKVDEALAYLDLSLALKDSILGVEKVKSLSEMEVRYETEKVEKEYAEEQQSRAEAELKVANRNNWIIAIGGGTLILILTGLVIYTRRMRKVQQEKNKAILEERHKGLKAVFEATEQERLRIARDLHDGVGQQMSGLKLAWENIGDELNKIDKDKLAELSKILDETAQEVRDISHQMMPKVLNEFGLVPAINEMLEKALKLSQINYHFEHFKIEERFNKEVELGLFRVCQELVNNVIKHADASNLNVQLYKSKDKVILMVEDDGVGFEANNNGHGLLTIQTRLNTIDGEINYETAGKKGTLATVRINLSKG